MSIIENIIELSQVKFSFTCLEGFLLRCNGYAADPDIFRVRSVLQIMASFSN